MAQAIGEQGIGGAVIESGAEVFCDFEPILGGIGPEFGFFVGGGDFGGG